MSLTLPGDIPGLLRDDSNGVWIGPTGVRRPVRIIRIAENGPPWSTFAGPHALVVIGPTNEQRDALAAFAASNHPAAGGAMDNETTHWAVCWLPLSELHLDLSNATGRAHAAWWLDAQPEGAVRDACARLDEIAGIDAEAHPFSRHRDRVHEARLGWDMTPEAIAMVRRVVLHLAGRT